MAIGAWYTIYMLVKVIVAFILFFLYIPFRVSRYDSEADKFLDKVFVSFIHMTATTIVVVHMLVMVRLYETLSLVLAYALIYLLLKKTGGRPLIEYINSRIARLMLRLMNFFDSQNGFFNEVRAYAGKTFVNLRRDFHEKLKRVRFDPYHAILPLAGLVGAAYIRLMGTVQHASYGFSDPYLHLIWVKMLGLNQLFHNGEIYPKGFHAVLSAFAKLSFIDPYWICRYIGAAAGVLIVLSVYYFALRVTNNRVAALVSAIIYGLVTHVHLPGVMSRETAALSQEFSMIFILPGLYFAWLYYNTGKRSYLFLYTEALLIILFTHSYSAVF